MKTKIEMPHEFVEEKTIFTAHNKGTTHLFEEQAINPLIVDFNGNVFESDEVLIQSNQQRGALRLLVNNPLILSPINARFSAVLAKLFKISTASGKNDSIKDMRLLKLSGEGVVHDFLYEQMQPYLKNLAIGFLKARLYGYSVFEIEYNKPQNFTDPVTIQHLWYKPFDWFIPQNKTIDLWWSPDNSPIEYRVGSSKLKFLDNMGTTEVDVDTEHKFLLVQNSATYDNPYGDAMLSKLYWSYFRGNQLQKFWTKFLEVAANQRLVGKSQNPEEMAENLSAFIQDGAIGIPLEATIDAIQNAGNGESFVNYKRDLEKSIWQFVTGRAPLSELQSGSRAAQESENNMTFQNYIDEDVDFCIDYFNQLTQMIWKTNEGRLHGECLEWYYDQEIGLHKERAERDKTLLDANPQLKLTEAYYRQKYDFDESHFTIADNDISNEAVKQLSASQENSCHHVPTQFAIENTQRIDGVKLKKNRDFEEENKTLLNNAGAIKSKIQAFFAEEKKRVLNALRKKESLDSIFQTSKALKENFFREIYYRYAVEYGLSGVIVDASLVDQVSTEIINHLNEEGVIEYESNIIDNTTQSTITSILSDAVTEGWSHKQTIDIVSNSFAFSEMRAELIANTVNAMAYNMGLLITAKMAGAQFKKWVHTKDELTRNVHESRGKGDYIPIDDSWYDWTLPIRYPLDFKASADDIIRCRCHLLFR